MQCEQHVLNCWHRGRTQRAQTVEGAVDLDEVGLQQVFYFLLSLCIDFRIQLCLCAWRSPPCNICNSPLLLPSMQHCTLSFVCTSRS